eukprot:g2678.t1
MLRVKVHGLSAPDNITLDELRSRTASISNSPKSGPWGEDENEELVMEERAPGEEKGGEKGNMRAHGEEQKSAEEVQKQSVSVGSHIEHGVLRSPVATDTARRGLKRPTPYQSYNVSTFFERALTDHVVLGLCKRLWNAAQSCDTFRMDRSRFLRVTRKLLKATEFGTIETASLQEMAEAQWQKWCEGRAFITLDQFNRFWIELARDRIQRVSLSVEQLARFMEKVCTAVIEPHGFSLRRENEIYNAIKYDIIEKEDGVLFNMAPPEHISDMIHRSQSDVLLSNVRVQNSVRDEHFLKTKGMLAAERRKHADAMRAMNRHLPKGITGRYANGMTKVSRQLQKQRMRNEKEWKKETRKQARLMGLLEECYSYSEEAREFMGDTFFRIVGAGLSENPSLRDLSGSLSLRGSQEPSEILYEILETEKKIEKGLAKSKSMAESVRGMLHRPMRGKPADASKDSRLIVSVAGLVPGVDEPRIGIIGVKKPSSTVRIKNSTIGIISDSLSPAGKVQMDMEKNNKKKDKGKNLKTKRMDENGALSSWNSTSGTREFFLVFPTDTRLEGVPHQ